MITPSFKILLNKADVTESLRPYLYSLHYTEETGERSDRIEICLSDNGHLEIPKKDSIIDLTLGNQNIGLFHVDEISMSEKKMTVVARSGAFRKGFSSPNTRGWTDTTVGEIVAKIADENNLKSSISDKLSAQAIESES